MWIVLVSVDFESVSSMGDGSRDDYVRRLIANLGDISSNESADEFEFTDASSDER